MSAQGDMVSELTSTDSLLANHYPVDAFGDWSGGFIGDYAYRAQDRPMYPAGQTGLITDAFRKYDPSTGRFLNRDPIGYDGGMNLYGYAGDDPVDGDDPMGTETFSQWYWGGMGGFSQWLDNSFLFDGATAALGQAAGDYDSGCGSGLLVAAADANWLLRAGAVAGGAVELDRWDWKRWQRKAVLSPERRFRWRMAQPNLLRGSG